MLAGYLPFDDDPANPEGDNINLLYKYIVTTPLTFPEYVTPHARDLLRRILVPNPRKRADLFEVARHSWLSEYAHVVEFITSSTTLPADVQDAQNASAEDGSEGPMVARSSSVRESSGKSKSPQNAAVGGLAKAHGKIDQEAEPRTPKDAKRRTVQVEYVAPTTQTQRGTDNSTRAQAASRGRDQSDSMPREKPLPQAPLVSRDGQGQAKPPSSHGQRNTSATQLSQEARSTLENPYIPSAATSRPRTGGSTHSIGLQSQGNYGQPAPPEIADTNVQGRIQQPDNEPMGRPSVSVPPKFARMTGMQTPPTGTSTPGAPAKGHKRSSTIGEISSKLLGRSGSMFGRSKKRAEQGEKSRKYPPVSMSQPFPTGNEGATRPSMDSRQSRRSFSLGLGKKRSGSIAGSQGSGDKQTRRFSLLPAAFSLKAIGLGKDHGSNPPSERGSQQNLPLHDPRTGQPRSVTAHGDARGSTPFFDNLQSQPNNDGRAHQRYASVQLDNRRPNAVPPHLQSSPMLSRGSETSIDMRRPPTEPQLGSYRHQHAQSEGFDGQRLGSSRGNGNRGVLQKQHKRFTDAYDQDDRGHEGSSGAAKRVMDFFRRRGKARGGEDS